MNVIDESRLLQDKLVGIRRDLHRIPEIGFTLPKTRKYIMDRLDSMGIEFTLNEEFSCYLEETPGAYLFLSSSNPEKGTDIDHHSCRFNIDEDVLWKGTAVFSQIAEDFLA